MTKSKKDRIEIARKIIASVKKEMQMPRLTESVRTDGERRAAAIVEVRSARSGRW
jgi:hypothetical protein